MFRCVHSGFEAFGRGAEIALRSFDFGASDVPCGEVVHAATLRPKSVAHLQQARRLIQVARLVE